MVEKLVQCVAIIFAVFFALMTGNALAHYHFDQVINMGAAMIVLLIIALWGAISKCDPLPPYQEEEQNGSISDREDQL